MPVTAGSADTLVSHTGVRLTRPTTFKFTLDVNAEQHQRLFAHAGASRLAFNHHIGRVKGNLELQRPGLGRTYYDKRIAAGDSKTEAVRALKRRLARVVFNTLKNNPSTATATGLATAA